MQLPKHLKQYRLDAGLSQEDLARRIFVTRQTISNWERGKTYPDIQSLLLLSEQLDVSIDELVKGDISIIRERVERDRGTLYRLGAGMLAGLLAFTVSMAWLMWQQNHGWGDGPVRSDDGVGRRLWCWRNVLRACSGTYQEEE